jgi:hypothetical protein
MVVIGFAGTNTGQAFASILSLRSFKSRTRAPCKAPRNTQKTYSTVALLSKTEVFESLTLLRFDDDVPDVGTDRFQRRQ